MKISKELEMKLRANFEKVYENLFEGALIRCDFFVVGGGDVYLNEINPIPGSMANYLFEDFNALLSGVENSLSRAKRVRVDYKYINDVKTNDFPNEMEEY